MATPVIETLLEIDEIDRVCLPGKRTRVSEMMAQKIGYGWSAEELIQNFPWYSPAAIYAALSYFAAHEQEILGEIKEDEEYMTAEAEKAGYPGREKVMAALAARHAASVR